MKRLLWLMLLGVLISPSAWALSLDEARQQGRVGETLSGYIAPIKQDSETLALVARINQGRAEHYQQLASRNNLTTAEVARIAGEKLVQRAAAGEYVRGINGQWLKKN
ncbi:YdbL family protein [Erwiniaceae bacterium BAC15a-03b]|uniref:YdbL family protein n=1 Tax=Winslowiella arboricola TaxID=2978220 RepID=A0A9J6PV26_9GAMM|nr:YdbL family protein [Winslowiella arboricola]MCU5775617.1 YdbL family protein [Winslowiella arboricola]MCU5779533.1 YdbL family protein [Winslowiella arboricola]